jgi:hypothetical protein
MRPFSISDKLKLLSGSYPDATALGTAITGIRRLELIAVLRLWLTEGIPYAFRSNPMLYETIREWMAMRLQINPKQVTLIGSARLGYSLCPSPDYGRAFGNDSDLDFSAIDGRVFGDLVAAFFAWESDVDAGRVAARNERERSFWQDNLRRMPDNIARGFIDPYKVPTLLRYPGIVAIQDMLFLLGERLRSTEGGPRVKRATLRVYKDWNSFFQQLSMNVSLTVASFVGSGGVTREAPPRTVNLIAPKATPVVTRQ